MGRSNYSFDMGPNISAGIQLINNWISGKGFTQETKDGETYFKSGDSFLGFKYFSCNVVGSTLNLSFWLKNGLNGNDLSLEELPTNSIPASGYRTDISNLFMELQKINNGNMNNNINQTTQAFINDATKKQEKLCNIGFWLSLLGLLCSFGGVTYGAIIYIMDFYFASQGLKTKKRGKAIATIIFSVISILITISYLLGSTN